ncbi:uncharacterized protein LOC112520073 [Cynara cardunculus var. scolymus]|uniref:Uncharacterized protein n=1 Tax=Cynara cardunculus var. scolymus TaxID=59895 RepID=A0A103Y126_CYNCS|nr:uncharacterized protein LOC112520073 [Cynara cardunculus var. scolymus]KVI00563.1 hypothetical protein Ccrd_021191 [Cynara cardunculus var. scolymus]
MRCKKHYTDLSSIVGVCASCLREHLLSLIAAQEQAQSQAQAHAQAQNLDQKHRNLEKNLVFPRSVSPYINYRKSDHSAGAAAWSHNNRRKDHHPHPPTAPRHHHSLSDQLFYRTPQVGPRPTTGCHNTGGHSHHKRSFMRWLSFPKIFRSRNRNSVDTVSVPGASDSTFREQRGGGNATSSPSWFSNIIHGGRYRKKRPVYVDESSVPTAGGVVRRLHCPDRGMSPVRNSDGTVGDEDELYDATSGYESTESMKQTPRRTPAHLPVRRGGGGGHARTLSGLTFCLSPMVRASPNRQWNQKSMPVDGGLSGEIRAPVKPHLSNTKSFCANRSRKLADFGRPNPNR